MQPTTSASAPQLCHRVLDYQPEHFAIHRLIVVTAFANAQQILHRVLACQLGNFVTRRPIVEMEFANVHRLLKHVAFQVKLVFQALASAELLHPAKI